LSVEIENGGNFVEVVWFLEKEEILAIAASKPAKILDLFDHFCIFVVIAIGGKQWVATRFRRQ